MTTATQEFKKEREKKYKVDPKVLFMDFPCTSYVSIAGIAKLCPKNHKASGKRRRAPKLAEFSYITVSLRANGAAIAAVLVQLH